VVWYYQYVEDLEQEFSFKNLFQPLTTTKAVIIIAIVGIIVYFNSFFNGFVLDDWLQIELNPAIRSLTNIPQFFSGGTYYNGDVQNLTGPYYRPVVTAFFALLYAAFGLQASAFHIFQAFFKAPNSTYPRSNISYTSYEFRGRCICG
jgi:hypothetical protein